ncbi:hypothetical protein JCM3774_004272 [Rhodotorula dairenensis]
MSAPLLDSADLLTVRYASHLAVVLCAVPALSSDLAQTRPHPRVERTGAGLLRSTQCGHCGAETVGGVAGASYWTQGARLFGLCGGCRTTTVRSSSSTDESKSEVRLGRDQFERVKKRRRTGTTTAPSRTPALEVSHPTAYRLAPTLHSRTATLAALQARPDAAPSPSTRTRPTPVTRTTEGGGGGGGGGADPVLPVAALPPRDNSSPLAPGLVEPQSTSPPRLDKESNKSKKKKLRRPSPDPMATTLPRRPSSDSHSNASRLSHAVSVAAAAAAATQSAVRSPPLGTAPTTTTAAPAAAVTEPKKRNKRPKQPTGLAHLLAQKKKEREAAERGAGGLMDFLQAL